MLSEIKSLKSLGSWTWDSNGQDISVNYTNKTGSTIYCLSRKAGPYGSISCSGKILSGSISSAAIVQLDNGESIKMTGTHWNYPTDHGNTTLSITQFVL